MLLVRHDNSQLVAAKKFPLQPLPSLLLLLLSFLLLSLRCYHCHQTDEVRYGPPCDSYIYCHGPLLHTIQMASLYTDSKTFVDMKMKQAANITMAKFETMMNETANRPTRHQLEQWVTENFDPEGSEFVPWEPDDWINKPKFLENIEDEKFRSWANSLNLLWKFLGRKMHNDVFYNPSLYSIMYVPHPVIVPGGRFREFYYWDSYWIIRGLLLSEMTRTVRGMLENYLYIVQNYGVIPNGGRVYYKMRSQPPLLIPMIELYFEATNDTKFIADNVRLMEKEFQFWMNNRTVKVEKDGIYYTLARYKEQSSGPRPESYREDYGAATFFRAEDDKLDFYNELKSAAESGWDFSTRWFILNGTNKGNLTNLKTRSIIPVELNSIICWNARLLTKYFNMINETESAAKYEKIADEWMEAIRQLLWHEEVGVWLDYDILNDAKRDYFYPTNISPLWTGCYRENETEYYVSRVLKYLERTQVINNNQGGIPSSLEHSGEQWDYPNAWAPLQYIMIMGLDNTGNTWAQDLAFDIAERWTRSNYAAYNAAHIMYEKYDASVPGSRGGGGEYEVQIGFGWSNGLILHLLNKYGRRITHDDDDHQKHAIMSKANPTSLVTAAALRYQLFAVVICLRFVVRYIMSSL